MPTNEEQPFKEKEWLSREKKGKDKQDLESSNKPITEKEASEFLKFIKHNEYSVIEQLNKTPTRISLLSLFQNSDTHRNALQMPWAMLTWLPIFLWMELTSYLEI